MNHEYDLDPQLERVHSMVLLKIVLYIFFGIFRTFIYFISTGRA